MSINVGKTETIRDWFNASFYNNEEIANLFIEKNQSGLKAYDLTIKGDTPEQFIKLVGQTSGQVYNVCLAYILGEEYGYQGIFFFSQDENVKIFDADSGEELLEYELSVGELPCYYHTIVLPPSEIGYITDSPFYKTAAETSTYFGDPTGLFTTIRGRGYYKHSAYEAYCGTVWVSVHGTGNFTAEFVISKDYAALKSSYMDQLFEDQYTTDYGSVSWKSVIGPYGWSGFIPPDPTTNFIDFSSEGTFASWADVIPRILQYIYEGQ